MKTDILALRKRADAELRLLFGIKDPSESQIMYMVGLYMVNADTVGMAISSLEKDWEMIHPSYPDADEPEESEEIKAQKRWEKGLK
jgi:hypothetical protein